MKNIYKFNSSQSRNGNTPEFKLDKGIAIFTVFKEDEDTGFLIQLHTKGLGEGWREFCQQGKGPKIIKRAFGFQSQVICICKIDYIKEWELLVEQTDQIIGKTIQDENKFSGNGYGISDFLKFRDSTIEIKYVLKNVNYFDVKLIQNNGREDFILSLKDSNIKNGVKEINVQDSIYIFDFESDGKWEIEILNK